MTGTSWQSDLEIEAIKLANLQGKRSVSFLDHWVNYQQRFMRDGKVYFPDEIWVGDDSALKIAKEKLPGFNVKLKSNPYFEDLKLQIDELKTSKNDRSC